MRLVLIAAALLASVSVASAGSTVTSIGLAPMPNWDMPAGPQTTRDDLQRAYNYCEEILSIPPTYCNTGIPASCPHTYNVSACYAILGRWEKSRWKKDEDADQKLQHEADIARAKAFVEAVAKQKRGQGE